MTSATNRTCRLVYLRRFAAQLLPMSFGRADFAVACLLENEATAMPRTYREIAIEEMLETVEAAMSQVIDWWADKPPTMKEAIEQFRIQLGAAIDSVDSVKRALDREIHETDREQGPP
jgi:hypothetical protein